MFSIILMEADFEPWWQFDDIEEKYTEIKSFNDFTIYEEEAMQIIEKFESLYDRHEQREGKYFAFWNEGDVTFCESCDEDLQNYYGIILSHPVKQCVK